MPHGLATGELKTTVLRAPVAVALALSLLLALSAGGSAAQELPVVNVGIVVDGPWGQNDYVRDLTREEILALTEGEFDVRFPDRFNLVGDWSMGGAVTHLQRLLEDDEVDLVIAWGVLASHSICCIVGVTKPVIAPVILDIGLQGVPYKDGASGIPNLTYVALPDTTADELIRFREIFPYQRVAILANRAIIEAIPDLQRRTELSLAGTGIAIDYVAVAFEAEATLAALPEGIDAVFMYPQVQLSPEENAKLVQGITDRGLLSFTALGIDFVSGGVLAGFGAADFFPRLARRIGLITQRILLGEEAGSIPVAIRLKQELAINMRTARALGVSPTYEALLEARVVHPEPAVEVRSLTLAEAVRDAVVVNLDLLAGQRGLLAGQEEVNRAASVFWPQIDLAALGLIIDEDRARASFGSQAERSLVGSAGLTQLLYSEDALANKSIQTSLQRGREADYERLRLDIALEAGVTYLELLRAKSLMEVQRSNVSLTRTNLELAEVRRRIGSANPAEVFRWESQLAADRKSLIESEARVRVVEVAVNRILGKPLDERFATEEVDLEKPWRVTGDPRIASYISTPARFKAFQDFMVEEGVEAAPELTVLRSAIDAQKRLLVNAKRSYWAPLVAAEAGVDEVFSKSGEGVEGPELPAGLDFPTANDTQWSVGLSATLPLFTGGGRKADRLQAEEELLRLRIEFEAASDRIEQRIRSAMELTRASRTGIGLARKAAVSAGKNLDLVTDSYARGAVPIIDLLDAQNAAVNAQELAANAVYDFLIDLLEAERAANRMELLGTVETAEAFFQRSEAYFRARGIQPVPVSAE